MRNLSILSASMIVSASAWGAEIQVKGTKTSLEIPDPNAAYWAGVPTAAVSLMAQPMVVPRPEVTTTPVVLVQALHDGRFLSMRLHWKDTEKSEAGRLGEFSDAAAVQFPMKAGPTPPPIFMGAKDMPVHIFHWRAQYQRDKERGKPTMRDLYPNMAIDIYPMEFSDQGTLGPLSETEREKFSPSRAAGNPQAYVKTGVDEIMAEGFSTSSVQEDHGSLGTAIWADGEWTLVVRRPLVIEGGSTLKVGELSFAGFAVWQGGQGEVGSRKAVTMGWTPVKLEAIP